MGKDKKIGLICSAGGHFTEMLQVREAFKGQRTFILTYREKATLDQANAYYLDSWRSPTGFIVGLIKIFLIFWKERPDILFSTGSEIAIPPFYLGKLFFGTKLIYLECSAQVYRPSLTGKFVYPITDLFLVQWEPLLHQYGPKARYVGGLI